MILPQHKSRLAAKPTFSVPDLVKKDPQTAALLSKYVQDRNNLVQRDPQGNRAGLQTEIQTIRDVLSDRSKKNRDAELHLQLNPDLEMCLQILVSSILSPSDMMSADVTYSGPEGVFTSDMSGQILTRIQKYMESEYDIKSKLPEMLRNILGEEGSYPVAVLPENAIDRIINSDLPVTGIGNEAFGAFLDTSGTPKALGILGSGTENGRQRRFGLSLEGFSSTRNTESIDQRLRYAKLSETGEDLIDDTIIVTDNQSVLRFEALHSRLRRDQVRARMKQFGLESSSLNDQTIEGIIARGRNYTFKPVEMAPRQSEIKRKSVGKPLIMNLNSASVAVVHVPGDPRKQVGYYVLLDAEGHPVSSLTDNEFYSTVGGSLANPASHHLSTGLMQRVSNNFQEQRGGMLSRTSIDYAAKIYGDLVERDLIARVKNGVHAASVNVTPNEEIYRLMLSRSLAGKYSQLLYIPIEYFTYFAFDYDANGLGRGLLERTSVVNTLRSVLLFNDVMASIRNSLGRTTVDVQLDDKDPNPTRTMEMVQEEVVRSGRIDIPTTAGTPQEILNFISRAGYRWKFSNHPKLPQLQVGFEESATAIPKSDTELTDQLKKLSIQGIGLSPETIDNGYAGEFATSIAASNLLFGKRVMTYQDQFCPQLADHLRKICLYSEPLLEEIRELVFSSYDDVKLELEEEVTTALAGESDEVLKRYRSNRAIKEFLLGLTVSLPKPPSVSLENQIADLEVYIRGLDAVIDSFISEDWIPDVYSGEAKQYVSQVKAMYKAYLIRKYVADKGIMPEFNEFLSTDEEGNSQSNVFDETATHIQNIVSAIMKTTAMMKPVGDAATRDMNRINESSEDDGAGSSGGSDSDAGSSDDAGGGDDDAGTDDSGEGGMDAGMGGDDMGGGEDDGGALPGEEDGGSSAGEDAEMEDEPVPDQ